MRKLKIVEYYRVCTKTSPLFLYSSYFLFLLLQPRKFKRKRFHKKRNFKIWSYKDLTYGTAGVRLQQSLRLSAKQMYRTKLFLKRAVRKSDRTQRYMWFSAFPHIPLSRKGKGSRMGKGAGKLAAWCIQIKPGTIFVEFIHLRFGRAAYFYKQIAYKSPVRVQLVMHTMGSISIRQTARANTTLLPVN